MRKVDTIIFVNESIRSEYQERYGVSGTVVRNCASLEGVSTGIDLYEVTDTARSSALVLYQGGFIEGRGLDVVVRSLADFPQNTHLILMGFGPMKEDLISLAEENHVDEKISIIEAVSPDQLIATTSSATIGLIPYQPLSLNNKLALPNKIFEYTAAGLPVVAAAIPELERIANSGVGLTYDPFDHEALAKAVEMILEPAALQSAREASEKWGRENAWNFERQRLIDAWSGVFAGHNAAAVMPP